MSTPEAPVIRVSIVEDDGPTRQSLEEVVRQTPMLRFVSSFAESPQALASLPLDQPDVILMDINLPEINGVECVRRLRPLLPRTQFLMLTVYEDSEHIFEALAVGATGYLLKSTRREDLIAGVLDIHEGGSPMTSGVARKVVRSFSGVQAPVAASSALSAREQEVLGLLAEGFLYKEIANRLNLNILTVRTYIRRIYEKLQVHSRSQAAAKYFRRPA